MISSTRQKFWGLTAVLLALAACGGGGGDGGNQVQSPPPPPPPPPPMQSSNWDELAWDQDNWAEGVSKQ